MKNLAGKNQNLTPCKIILTGLKWTWSSLFYIVYSINYEKSLKNQKCTFYLCRILFLIFMDFFHTSYHIRYEIRINFFLVKIAILFYGNNDNYFVERFGRVNEANTITFWEKHRSYFYICLRYFIGHFNDHAFWQVSAHFDFRLNCHFLLFTTSLSVAD